MVKVKFHKVENVRTGGQLSFNSVVGLGKLLGADILIFLKFGEK